MITDRTRICTYKFTFAYRKIVELDLGALGIPGKDGLMVAQLGQKINAFSFF